MPSPAKFRGREASMPLLGLLRPVLRFQLLIHTLIAHIISVLSHNLWAPNIRIITSMEDNEINVTTEELSRLTPSDHRELQQFIQSESQKGQIQKSTIESSRVSSASWPFLIGEATSEFGRILLLTIMVPDSRPRAYGDMLQEMHNGINIFG